MLRTAHVPASVVILAGLAASSAAQDTADIGFSGRVIEVVDDRGILGQFVPGQAAEGQVVLDLDAQNPLGDVDIFPFGLAFFEVPAFSVTVDGNSFDGVEAQADIVNDGPFPGQAGFVDAFAPRGITFLNETTSGSISGAFIGDTTLFEDATIDGPTQIGLEQLDLAEVTIEFSIYNGSGDFLDPANFTTSRIIIEVLTLNSGGNRIDLSCIADVNDDDEVDFGDFFAWVNAFQTNDFRADINLDGNVNSSDFFAWVNAFQNGDCNAS